MLQPHANEPDGVRAGLRAAAVARRALVDIGARRRRAAARVTRLDTAHRTTAVAAVGVAVVAAFAGLQHAVAALLDESRVDRRVGFVRDQVCERRGGVADRGTSLVREGRRNPEAVDGRGRRAGEQIAVHVDRRVAIIFPREEVIGSVRRHRGQPLMRGLGRDRDATRLGDAAIGSDVRRVDVVTHAATRVVPRDEIARAIRRDRRMALIADRGSRS